MSEEQNDSELLFLDAIKRGIFEIDNTGRIWRLGKFHNHGTFIKLNKRRAELDTNGRGYLRVWFMAHRHHYTCQAHRLVWRYFNGDIPSGFQINHKNGIKYDNRPDNIELVSPRENQLHALYIIKTKVPNYGERNGNAKINADQVLEIRNRAQCGDSISLLSQAYNLSYTHMRRIVNHQRWSHIA